MRGTTGSQSNRTTGRVPLHSSSISQPHAGDPVRGSIQSFLYCDQIGKTLTNQSKSKLNLIVTDQTTLIGLETTSDQILVLLVDNDKVDQLQSELNGAHRLEMGLESGTVPFVFTEDTSQLARVKKQLELFSRTLPLDEPFERIESAIDEAQSVAR